MKKLAVVAIGGNSLIKDHKTTVQDQYNAVCETARHIADLIENNYDVVVSHGNGPQVGYMLLRSEIAAETTDLHPVPLVNCDADTQGAIGYQIQQAMDNEFRKRKINQIMDNSLFQGEILKTAVTMVTQVAVDKNDPAFATPTKPIGSFYSKEDAEKIKQKYPDWKLVEDAGRGYRRVVPSPKPLEILELEAIEILLKAGFLVVAAGGGGIPVVRSQEDQWEGVDAVIDKDFATSLLADQLNADLLIISTGVEKAFINFGKHNVKGLDEVTCEEMEKYMNEGHFAPGSMLPKIQAAVKFVKNSGGKAIITDPEHLQEAITGHTGTHIVKTQ
ncbi:MAG TPA: carbamate kinase [Victivallales bacterium]|nr:carbamate kinase [Victivallales bacterium]